MAFQVTSKASIDSCSYWKKTAPRLSADQLAELRWDLDTRSKAEIVK